MGAGPPASGRQGPRGDFAARITRMPIPHDAVRAEAVAALVRGRAGLAGPLAELAAGAAGCSPFLAGLIEREAEWIGARLAAGPETVLADAVAGLGALSPPDVPAGLRQARARVALTVALADLGGVFALEEVTAALTDFADRAVGLALRAALAEEIRRGRLPGATEADLAGGAGMFVLAMGKMGAGELNYSSDIDLICLFDETRFAPADLAEARAAFIRATRRMAAILSDVTAAGHVFRTDLRLRPDAAVTPVCISAGAAEQYYEAQGRTWERAAYIKARVAAGDMAAGERFLAALRPFVWRRHLDFAAIRDAHDMRLRIRDHKGLGGPLSVPGHDLKLGPGGIREIEFFTQTRQLIAGGRDPDLRQRDTVGALGALAAKGWVPVDVADRLAADYRAHREIEHRLQMVNDAQTQTMPTTGEGLDRIARMCGAADTGAFLAQIRERLMRVEELTEGFFNPAGGAEPAPVPPAFQAVIDGWRAYPALRSERAVALFKRILPDILAGLDRAANPAEALNQFDAFLSRLPAGVQLFSLFAANPQLIDLIVDIAATAPALSDYLARNAGVLDAVIGGDFFTPWPGGARLAGMLAGRLEAPGDYERRLDAARIFVKEWHFRVGVHHLRGLVDAPVAGREYADLAGAAVAALWPVCVGEFAQRHGPPPGQGAVVLGMGSLGAERLNAASDLDLIVIYDAAGAEASAGPRPLPVRTYYARLTQALVTALSAQLPEGRLYAVDMRLRPSGRQGPVAVSLEAFRAYQLDEAWTWEHLALTRARPVAGEAELAARVEAVRREVLAAKAAGAHVAADTAAMRARLFAARGPDGAWEAKVGPGRLMDIELLAQSLALRAADPARRVEAQLRAGLRAGLVGKAEVAALEEAYRLLWRLHAGARLLTDRPLDMGAIGEGGRAFLLRETGAADLDSLAARLREATGTAAAIVAEALSAGGNGE
ncbi:MAG: glutamine-synthetase adenylyltransferase [Rhodobacteraceae bacterium]|nr:glutamine-synthetase adenylyltransferase [Paracoccaceae bacterium]